MDREFDESIMFDADMVSSEFEVSTSTTVNVWTMDYNRFLWTGRYRFGIQVESIDYTNNQTYSIRIYNDQHSTTFSLIEGHGHENSTGIYRDMNSRSWRIDKDLLDSNFTFELTTSGTDPYIKGFCFIVDESGS